MSASERWLSRALLLLVFLALALRVPRLVTKLPGADESAHLHAAWAIAQGQVPYRDFWQSHTPLLYYLMAPIFALMGEDLRIIYVARGLMLLCILLILLQLYRIAQECYDDLTGLLAVLLFSVLLLEWKPAYGTRPDIPQTLVVLVGLRCFMSAWKSGRRIDLLASGFLLGIGFWLLTKTLFPLAGLTLVFATSACLRRSRLALRRNLTMALIFLAAFAVPVVIGTLHLWYAGALAQFLRWGVVYTFIFPERFSPLTLLRLDIHGVFFGLALVGMVLAVAQMIKERAVDEVRLSPLLACSVTAAIFLFLMPAPYRHSALPFLPLAAMYGADITRRVAARALAPAGQRALAGINPAVRFLPSLKRLAWVGLLALLIYGACVPPLRAFLSLEPFEDSSREHLEAVRYVLALTSPGDSVFDRAGQYIFRPHATYFYRLAEGILPWLTSGFIPDIDIMNDLRKSQCKVLMADSGFRRLPPTLIRFLDSHYVPTGFEQIAVAGRLLHPTDLTANRATVSLIASTEYAVQAKGGTPRVTIDGQVYRAPLLLAQGDHQVIVEGEFQALVIFWSRVLTVPFPRPAALPTGRPDRVLPPPPMDGE